MEIIFKRRLTNELLTTYLPSFLLLLMAYATTFFKEFYFEAAVTVNLSILLVTTTLFVRWEFFQHKRYFKDFDSVMEKLPATSYVRLVDIWLIFCQLIPFIEVRYWGLTVLFCCKAAKAMFKVTLTTVAELYNEDDNTINHHGFTRKVGMEEVKVKIHHTTLRFTIIMLNYNFRLAQIIIRKRKYLKLLVGIILNMQIHRKLRNYL